MKTCSKCGETKGLEEFHRNKCTKDGRARTCKVCRAASYALGPKDPGKHRRMAELVVRGLKRCYKCGGVKALDEFHRSKRLVGGRDSECKACCAAASALRRKDPGKHARIAALRAQGLKRCYVCGEVKALDEFHWARGRKDGHADACRVCKGARRRERSTGHTPALVQALMVIQGGGCAVCGTLFTKTPCADHCHGANAPRGLLCHDCNTVEGRIKKTGLTPSEFGRRLQAYIENPPATLAQDALNLAG